MKYSAHGEQIHLKKSDCLPRTGLGSYTLCRCCPPGTLSRVIAQARGRGTAGLPIEVEIASESEDLLELDSGWTSDHERIASHNAGGEFLCCHQISQLMIRFQISLGQAQSLGKVQQMDTMAPSSVLDHLWTKYSRSLTSQTL